MDCAHDKHSDTAAGTVPGDPHGGELAARIRAWARELGFSAVGIADLDVSDATAHLQRWLAEGCHGQMQYMERHAHLRANPGQLFPGALRVISVRMDYLRQVEPPAAGAMADAGVASAPAAADAAADGPEPAEQTAVAPWATRERARQGEGDRAVVSLYARGRDYHKVVRGRLRTLAARIAALDPAARCRPFCDSAPVFEVELARKAGLGWRGKHTLLLSREAGSMFFLGELLTNLPLPIDVARDAHCGSCTRCIAACPTGAITGAYRLDARRCISYLTIEHPGPIAPELRPLIGNRIYGCDDCQLVCPWNRHARRADVADFDERPAIDREPLAELLAWDAAQFASRTAGMAILRIGHERWLRNVAIALGNGPRTAAAIAALRARQDHPSSLVREHVHWALVRLGQEP